MEHDRIVDLDELALACRDKKAQAYLREAIACYRAGAMRAAILSTWIAVAFDFIDKVHTLETQGDAQAKQFAEQFRKIREAADVAGSLAFEREILNRAYKDLGLVSALEYEDLLRLYADRHRCAHPSMISDEELYQPTAEQVRYHIRAAVTSMLSQPPTSGKAALAHLTAQVEGSYFPVDRDKARSQLEVGTLRKPRPALVRNFAIVLQKMLTDASRDPAARARAAAALNALRVLHPDLSNAALKERFTDLLRGIKDEQLQVAIQAVSWVEDPAPYVADDVRIRLTNFVDVVPEEEFSAVATAAWAIPFLKDTVVARAAKLSNRNFAKVLAEAPAKAATTPELRKKAIDAYKGAGSFNQANAMATQIIMPLVSSFTKEEIADVVTAGFTNDQIRYSNELPNVLAALKSNPAVQEIWWDPLLTGLGAADSHPNLLFKPPQAQELDPPSDDQDIPF